MTDVFEEVDESLRQDALTAGWRKASPYVFGVVALIIVGVGGYEWMKAARTAATETSARSFGDASEKLEKNDIEGAKKDLEIAARGSAGFAALAGNLQAEPQIAGSPANSEAALAKAAQGAGILADVALLKLAYMRADKQSLPDLEKSLARVVASGGPLAALAQELIAAKALASGDIERARKDYQAVSLSLDAPQGMQRRVQQALALMPPPPSAAVGPLKPASAVAPPADKASAPQGKPK